MLLVSLVDIDIVVYSFIWSIFVWVNVWDWVLDVNGKYGGKFDAVVSKVLVEIAVGPASVVWVTPIDVLSINVLAIDVLVIDVLAMAMDGALVGTIEGIDDVYGSNTQYTKENKESSDCMHGDNL